MMEPMIAAIAQKSSWSLDKLPFGWFDLLLVVVLALGLWRGRRHGMSREFLPVVKWLGIVAAGSFGYALLGEWLMHLGVIKSVFGRSVNERTAAFVSAYLLIGLVVYILFTLLTRGWKAKMEGSNAFGGSEYYLGMMAGLIRYAAVTLAALALLKAPVYSAQEIAAHKKYMMDNFGLQGAQRGNFKSDDISGEYLPNLQTIQAGVFETSLIGPLIKNYLDMLLINTTSPSGRKPAAQTPVTFL
jgi:uncharacterized membrane protein required for colicin V production